MLAMGLDATGDFAFVSAKAPKVSVVTATYNNLELTKEFLVSLEQTVQRVPHEILLVDDGSTDGTREFLSTLPSSRH